MMLVILQSNRGLYMQSLCIIQLAIRNSVLSSRAASLSPRWNSSYYPTPYFPCEAVTRGVGMLIAGERIVDLGHTLCVCISACISCNSSPGRCKASCSRLEKFCLPGIFWLLSSNLLPVSNTKHFLNIDYLSVSFFLFFVGAHSRVGLKLLALFLHYCLDVDRLDAVAVINQINKLNTEGE